ncbi:uncharacterized protein LOC126672796 [Mercurialis annua]|uniref:uncharacterized protein LOC126672796 n=1 Tax=Mercurialis annua TaxID=3986 RepID=UPI00215F4578|nr:uncharacterized protein LOC126672796 [Mercurialis annua]
MYYSTRYNGYVFVHASSPMNVYLTLCIAACYPEDVKPPPLVLKAVTCLSRVLAKEEELQFIYLYQEQFRLIITTEIKQHFINGLLILRCLIYNSLMRLKTAVELLKATEDIEALLEKVSAPLLIIHGAADKVTDPQVSQFLYERASSKDKILKLSADKLTVTAEKLAAPLHA